MMFEEFAADSLPGLLRFAAVLMGDRGRVAHRAGRAASAAARRARVALLRGNVRHRDRGGARLRRRHRPRLRVEGPRRASRRAGTRASQGAQLMYTEENLRTVISSLEHEAPDTAGIPAGLARTRRRTARRRCGRGGRGRHERGVLGRRAEEGRPVHHPGGGAGRHEHVVRSGAGVAAALTARGGRPRPMPTGPPGGGKTGTRRVGCGRPLSRPGYLVGESPGLMLVITGC